jgi:hypothetical protein
MAEREAVGSARERGTGTLTGIPGTGSGWTAGAHSSVVEHSPYKRGVTGSNPVAPTSQTACWNLRSAAAVPDQPFTGSERHHGAGRKILPNATGPVPPSGTFPHGPMVPRQAAPRSLTLTVGRYPSGANPGAVMEGPCRNSKAVAPLPKPN